jgi:hypothetical protein
MKIPLLGDVELNLSGEELVGTLDGITLKGSKRYFSQASIVKTFEKPEDAGVTILVQAWLELSAEDYKKLMKNRTPGSQKKNSSGERNIELQL